MSSFYAIFSDSYMKRIYINIESTMLAGTQSKLRYRGSHTFSNLHYLRDVVNDLVAAQKPFVELSSEVHLLRLFNLFFDIVQRINSDVN